MRNFSEKLKKILQKRGGYTLIELLAYMAIIAIIAIVVFDVIFFIYRINYRIMSMMQAESSAFSAAERMIYEIQNSKYIYLPTSNFDNFNNDATKGAQLALVTDNGVILPETTAFMDFYVDNSTLFLKKDGVADPIALTSANVSVSDLKFLYYKNEWRESVTIDMTVRPVNNLNSGSSVHVISTAALRSSND